MKIAILATGDEIVQGDVLNTNTRFIAQALQAEGFSPHLHMACCDSEQQIQDCLAWLVQTQDMIIITGGLGPTSDDKTRFALARFAQTTLIEYPQAMEHIESRLKTIGLTMNEGNRQQALFPEDTQLFPNPYGSAFGGCYTWNNKQFILLPGPPRECAPMFNNYVLPLVQALQQTSQILLRWRVFGVPESLLGEMMDKALAELACETGYRWDPPYVEFKVRCDTALGETIKNRVDPLLAPYIISSLEQKASEQLRAILNGLHKTVVIHDNATGGVLQTLIQGPENHAFLKFDTSMESADWSMEIKGLDAYWSGQKEGNTLSLQLRVQHQGHVQEDSYELPYFGSLILHYAAEWLSFRIAQMIKK